MKKLFLFAMTVACLSIFNACEKSEELIDQSVDLQLQATEKPDVYSENGYLVFSTKEVFDSVRFVIERLSIEECIEWEKSMNFTSAKTRKYLAEEEALRIDDEDAGLDFEKKYGQWFYINDDFDINYKFYATGLEDVLDVNGLVKIEGTLYKFSAEKEYIVLNGNYSELQNLQSNLKSGYIDSENIIVFDPNSTNEKLKSTDILDEGIKTVGIRRLVWSVEKYVFSSILNFDPYTGQTTYKAGYELTLVMNQEKYRGLFSKSWQNNEASYDLENQYIDWSEIGVSPTPGYTGWFADDHIGTTRNTIKVHYVSREYHATQPINRDFVLRDFRVTFWSSGILEANKVSVDL